MKKYFPWVLTVWIAFVFIQSLAFKFTGSKETEIIFGTIADWMHSVDALKAIAPLFSAYGGWGIGLSELVASVLLFIPKTRFVGALMGLGIMTGAIFFHLFTPLGVDRIVNDAGDTDGGVLFYMACSVWVSCLILLGLTNPFRKAEAWA